MYVRYVICNRIQYWHWLGMHGGARLEFREEGLQTIMHFSRIDMRGRDFFRH
jgi:hypothetical protein